ncbi:WD40-repeat-containing domain protein [Zychaea mexicana]|uniref:WD40-repeat-containing domain protein n=1 Tax=Zychaea mexicana TaxID=64656 RepID=UPI0022FEAB22|nr:WD40-repeat-containing domain protein [Zychaea mexicana]KAI9489509.1 WD40-repeat-containing domain protein [Zychaea mexicana]
MLYASSGGFFFLFETLLYIYPSIPSNMAPYPTHCDHTLTGHKEPISQVRYNKSGQYCVSGGRDRTVRLWNPTTGMELHKYMGHGRDVLGVSVSPDNAKLASCGVDRAVILWDVGTGEILRRYTAHWERVNGVDFNDQGTVLVSGSFDATVRIWDCRSSNFSPIQVLEDCKDSVMSIQVRDVEIVAGSADGRVRRYDLRNGQLSEDYIGPAITSARLSHDGNCVLVSTLDDTVRLMDKSNGTLLNEFTGHKHKEFKVESVMSNTDAYAVSGSEDGHIHIWDVLEGNKVETLKSHDTVVTSVDYHPSDVAIVTAGDDGAIRVWS